MDLFDRGELEPTMEEADIPRIQEILEGRDQVWLVYSHNWYSDPDGIIPRELGRLFGESEQTDFRGLRDNPICRQTLEKGRVTTGN